MLTISPLGQQLFFATKGTKHGVVTLEFFKNLELCREGTLKVVISRLLKKGALLKLKNGVYAWNMEGNGVEDMFFAAQNVFNGYLAFSTALYLRGLSEQFPFTIYIATRGKSASRIFGQTELKAVAIHSRATGVERLGDYEVSSVAKTIYDCFHLPEYAGGLSAVLEAIHRANMNKIQWAEFLTYVDRFESNNSKKKIGAYLNLLQETDKPVPSWVVSHLGKAELKLDKKELLYWWFV